MIEQNTLEWVKVAESSNMITYRTKTPEGWLIMVKYAAFVAMSYVPDIMENWK